MKFRYKNRNVRRNYMERIRHVYAWFPMRILPTNKILSTPKEDPNSNIVAISTKSAGSGYSVTPTVTVGTGLTGNQSGNQNSKGSNLSLRQQQAWDTATVSDYRFYKRLLAEEYYEWCWLEKIVIKERYENDKWILLFRKAYAQYIMDELSDTNETY
jgi:hypothetical protein